MIGAGGQAGQSDAANLLKPALARGELRTIAATTWAEYKKYFEKDPALTRRFQVVKVDEPTRRSAIVMMRGVAAMLEKHHKVAHPRRGGDGAVKLSHRYIPERQLPDKAVSLLDTACARVALGQHATPPPSKTAAAGSSARRSRPAILERERATGADARTSASRSSTPSSRRRATERAGDSKRRWEKEKELARASSTTLAAQAVTDARRGRAARARGAEEAAPERATRRAEPAKLDALEAAGRDPLMRSASTRRSSPRSSRGWTGIPVGKMVNDEIETVLTLDEKLEEARDRPGPRARRHRPAHPTSRARTSTIPRSRSACSCWSAPAGVGKTETAAGAGRHCSTAASGT